MTFGTVVVALSIWVMQSIALFMVLGIVTRFVMEMDNAAGWAIFWPIRGPWRLIAFLIRRACSIISEIRNRKLVIIERCRDEGAAYLQGLLEDDDDAYIKGLYGQYQPVEIEWPEGLSA